MNVKYFWFNHSIFLVQKENVENFYSFYMRILMTSFEKLQDHVGFMLSKLKNEDQKKFIEKVYEIFQTKV